MCSWALFGRRAIGCSPLYGPTWPGQFSVGVTLDVRLHRFVVGVNRGGELGKNLRVCSVRRGIRKWGFEPGAVGKGSKKF